MCEQVEVRRRLSSGPTARNRGSGISDRRNQRFLFNLGGDTDGNLVWLFRIGTSDSGVAIRKIGFSSRFSMELDSGGLLQLLSRMKEEHARSAAAIEALDRSAAESSRRLEHQRETIDRMGEDVNQIVAKTLQSAGSARQVSEVRPLHPPAKVSLPSPSLARAALSSFPHVRPLQL